MEENKNTNLVPDMNADNLRVSCKNCGNLFLRINRHLSNNSTCLSKYSKEDLIGLKRNRKALSQKKLRNKARKENSEEFFKKGRETIQKHLGKTRQENPEQFALNSRETSQRYRERTRQSRRI